MTLTRDELEDQAARYETRLAGLKSYVRELRETASKHGTDESLLEEDLTEAEHNMRFFEAELERVRGELRSAPDGPGQGGGGGSLLPVTGRQSIGALGLVALGFAAGVLVGKLLNPERSGG